QVWAYACDVGRWQEWAPTVRECWVAGGGPLEPGSRLEQRAKGPFGSTHHRAQNVTWVEADLKNVMRAIPGGVLKGRIRRVMDIEMVAIKAAVESAAPAAPDSTQ